jgi:hypothetical protein
MLSELREDNVALTGRLREGHEVAEDLRDIAAASSSLVGLASKPVTQSAFPVGRRTTVGLNCAIVSPPHPSAAIEIRPCASRALAGITIVTGHATRALLPQI